MLFKEFILSFGIDRFMELGEKENIDGKNKVVGSLGFYKLISIFDVYICENPLINDCQNKGDA